MTDTPKTVTIDLDKLIKVLKVINTIGLTLAIFETAPIPLPISLIGDFTDSLGAVCDTFARLDPEVQPIIEKVLTEHVVELLEKVESQMAADAPISIDGIDATLF